MKSTANTITETPMDNMHKEWCPRCFEIKEVEHRTMDEECCAHCEEALVTEWVAYEMKAGELDLPVDFFNDYAAVTISGETNEMSLAAGKNFVERAANNWKELAENKAQRMVG